MTDLPPHMRTPEWIASEIRYEEHQGVHTYHACNCGESCRSVMCADCWRKVTPISKSMAKRLKVQKEPRED